MKRIIIGIVLLVLIATLAMTLLAPEEDEKPIGYVEIIKTGRAGGEGYFLFAANGTGSIRLLALDEIPKTNVYVLSESGINVERFDEFVDGLAPLEKYGIGITVIGRSEVNNMRDSVLIVPTGAMPSYVLDGFESITNRGNRIIYLGKLNYVNNAGSLRKDYWYTKLENETNGTVEMIIREYTMDEFLDLRGGMENLRGEILENEWAVGDRNSFNFTNYGGEESLFVKLPESGYLRFIYEAGEDKGIKDTELLAKEPLEIMATEELFPWGKAELEFTVERSYGKVLYSLEKEGEQSASEELGHISPPGKDFLYQFEFEEPGDYIFKVYDGSGMLGSAHMHVKDIEVKIADVRDVRVMFNITIDGKPVKSGSALVSFEGAEEEREYPIINGIMSVPAKLSSGKNTFKVRYLEYRQNVVYERTKEGLFDVYLKYGPFAALLIAVVYGYGRVRKKPAYVLKIEKMGRKKRNVVTVEADQILYCVENAEKTFGWKNVPISFKELVHSIKKNITDGADMYDGDLDSILKRLEEKGLVEGYGGYYQLKGWGDVKENVLKRQIRDRLVLSGERFEESNGGFQVKQFLVSINYHKTKDKLVVVFEDEQDRRNFLESLPPEERALLDLKMENDLVRITTLQGLDEIL